MLASLLECLLCLMVCIYRMIFILLKNGAIYRLIDFSANFGC